jgi:hypothetical protein
MVSSASCWGVSLVEVVVSGVWESFILTLARSFDVEWCRLIDDCDTNAR